MITLDPKFLTLSKKTKSSKTQKKKDILKKTKLANTGALRKQLLNKIKDYQKKNDESLQDKQKNNNNNLEDDFSGEFNKSLQFLNNLSSKKKKTHKHNRKSSNKDKSNLENISVSTELPTELLDDSNMKIPHRNHSIKNYSHEPSYGCLKNGTKPTYREWKNKTQKNFEPLSLSIDKEPLSERELALQKVKDKFQETKKAVIPVANITPVPPLSPKVNMVVPQELENNATVVTSKVVPTVETEHRIKTKKYKLGKNKTHKLVGVLIKNKDTRRRVSKEKDNLKKKTIVEVKNYLKKCNLLKSGSDAPPDVLRTMYEQAVLAGNITNKTKDTLVHNFYNT